jgi:hypothetical protein
MTHLIKTGRVMGSVKALSANEAFDAVVPGVTITEAAAECVIADDEQIWKYCGACQSTRLANRPSVATLTAGR